MKNTSETCSLQNLTEGDRFEIPSLRDCMKNMSVVTVGSGSVTIKGSKKGNGDNTDEWVPFQYAVSCGTQVKYLPPETVEEVVAPEVAEVPAVEVVTVKAKRGRPRKEQPEVVGKAPTGKRGRPAKAIAFKFPKGDWTIAEVAELNGCKKYDVVNYLNKQKKDGNAPTMTEVGSKKAEGRGKPSKIYRMI